MESINRSVRRCLALAVVVGALAAPAASARPIDLVPATATDAPPAARTAVPPPAPASEPITVSGDGFDWGDAGIGATAILALAVIAAGTTMASGRRLSHHDAA